jgi:hypothetical protein
MGVNSMRNREMVNRVMRFDTETGVGPSIPFNEDVRDGDGTTVDRAGR